MKRQCVGFTLVEMLFVVIIAAVIVAFALPSFKSVRETSADRKASGYLVDLAQAKQAFEHDLRLQGVTTPWAMLNNNLQVTPGVLLNGSDLLRKTLTEYLLAKNYSADALKTALFAYGYLVNDASIAPSGYSYYIFTGYDFPANCGTLPSDVKKVAFMCKNGGATANSPAGWSYLTDGSIRAHE